jgi:pyruvate/2-oxoglutarate dehydrogenase complex dihydrolipoamide dehydrogenase (E3) component
MGQAFARLGCRVTVVDMLPQVLGAEDADMAALVQAGLEGDGVELQLNSRVKEVRQQGGTKRVVLENSAGETEIAAEELLLALGRRGNTADLNLEAAGVEQRNSFIPVDRALRSNRRHIYACGDVNGRFLFTHAAGAEGSFIVRKALLHLPGKMEYAHLPWATYTEPELASVGLNEKRASERGVRYRVVGGSFGGNDRALAEGAGEGHMKVLLDRRERIIGVQIAGVHAGELLSPGLFAVKEGWKIGKLMGPIYPYPTLSELYRTTASEHLSPRLFNPRVRGLLRTLFGYRG